MKTAIKRLLWIAGTVVVLALATVAVFWARPVSFFNGVTSISLRLGGAESREVTVGGHHLYYYALGPANGPVVVLVHGLGGRSEDWNKLAPFLSKAGVSRLSSGPSRVRTQRAAN